MDMEGLSSICAGLGIIEDDENGNRVGYTKGEYCLDNLKDLLRFMRRDDPQAREVFKQVCKWNTVAKDLIPIIEHCQDDRNLVLNAVKVLVFLTMPIELSSSDIPQQIEYLWGLKSSITCSDTVVVIVLLLESPLENLEREAFTEDDWKLVQLVLTLFRNILAIQDISMLHVAGGSATQFLSLRDRFLELLFHENVMDLILVLTQHVGGSCGYLRQDNLLLLEIFHYIFMGQDKELIAKAYLKGSKVDGDAKTSLDSLRSIVEEEEEKRKLTRLRNLGCYSQFSGTFTRLTMDGSKTLFKGNPCSATLLKPHKNHRGPLKRTAWDHGKLPSTKNNLLELLHNFVNQFLSGGYNVLMQSILEDIEKEHHAIQNSDIVIFFQVAQFVTSFQYHEFSISKPSMEADTFDASVDHHADSTLFKGNICGPLAASMNESMFQLVYLKWRNAFDSLKETNDHKFLSTAGSLMKIMIRLLDLVLKLSPEDSKEPQTARILLYKLFYDQTDQGMTQFLLNLIKSFDTHKQGKSDLADLVEMLHVVIRLMENLQARGTLRVSRKSRKKRTKKTLNDKKDDVDEPVGNHVNIQNETVISGCEQSVDLSMSQKKSENSSFEGKGEDIIPDQFDEPETSKLETANLGSNLPEMENKKFDHTNDDLYYGTGDSSGDEQLALTDEVDFKVSTLVSALANNNIIRNLCWLLKFYKSNSTSTNHYIICMLRRICDDLELSPMLYQLSLLTTFYDILIEQKSCPCKEYENIVTFLKTLVRRMLRKMKNQPLLFVELLFWKTRKECHYINCESLLHELGDLKKESRKWGSLSTDGEVGASKENGWVRRSIADALGDDEADLVMSHEMHKQKEDPFEVQKVLQRSNGSIGEAKESIRPIPNDGKENSEKYGLQNEGNFVEHESDRVSKRRKNLVLDDELQRKIKGLYEKYKDNKHCSRLIAEALNPDGKVSPVQVSNKLRQLGLKTRPKRRMLHAGGSNELREDGTVLGSDITVPYMNDLEESSPPRQRSLHTKKRVRAFSEDQEKMIKALFEQFKDHRRCSYMIANALDADGTVTAAQVSRKLKQLGLHIPQQKKSEADMHLRDEDINDLFTEGSDNSDDETLLSLLKRSKNKQDERGRQEAPNLKIDGKLLKDASDDEFLSSVLEKTARVLSNTKNVKLTTTSIKQTTVENDSGYGDAQDLTERNGFEQPTEMEAAEINDVTFDHAGNAEAEASGISSRKPLGVAFVDNADNLQHQKLHNKLADELADFEDDATPVVSQTSAVLRRKLRMVIDFEDDE
ncbi:hypothetical protein F0562_026682 [Nyssa sinensis]|uniref:Timeless N-terminal domain-containing protein n=1 Tax=Nyssa sinensis TaxID=561372 RepID=A0A5J5BC57_9ASTE|nr:hypothetical protein F0562_026682 [Nyssa sinensis]